MKERRKVRKRADFNLFGQYLLQLYRELGISSDKEVAQKAGLHQTTLSSDKHGDRRATARTIEKLIAAFRTYPQWDESYVEELYVAADRALPDKRKQLEQRLKQK